jgi:hypothetical protein
LKSEAVVHGHRTFPAIYCPLYSIIKQNHLTNP